MTARSAQLLSNPAATDVVIVETGLAGRSAIDTMARLRLEPDQRLTNNGTAHPQRAARCLRQQDQPRPFARARYGVPWLTIMLGSLTPLLPVIAPAPILPPLGFLIMLAWRLCGRACCRMWAGLPLGAVRRSVFRPAFRQRHPAVLAHHDRARTDRSALSLARLLAGLAHRIHASSPIYLLASALFSGAEINSGSDCRCSCPRSCFPSLRFHIVAQDDFACSTDMRLTRVRRIG